MTEKQIQLLGFEREDFGGYDVDDHYYYSYSIANGFGFISCSDDQAVDGEWYIDFFDSWPNIRFTSFEEVQALINLIEKRVIK